MKLILMTGHCGLIGRYLKLLLEKQGYIVRGFDIADSSGDILNYEQLSLAVEGCVGIVHLAAVSRVVWAENNPDLCWRTNALASEQLLNIARQSLKNPWVLVVSSREVYGEATELPVPDYAPLMPVNIYGRSKAYMEEKALEARAYDLNTAVVRLSNVYGCIRDHSDRVLPSFCRNAAEGKPLRVDGKDHLFDFTYISDAVAGLVAIITQLELGASQLPPMHLLPGIGTTLGEAALLAISAAESTSRIFEAPSRKYDVSRFVGAPENTNTYLNWKAKFTPEQGIGFLVQAFKENIRKGILK